MEADDITYEIVPSAGVDIGTNEGWDIRQFATSNLGLHSNTTDQSTTCADAFWTHTPTVGSADVAHDTSQNKFGMTSILFDGDSGYLEVPDHADFDFDSDNFTIDLFPQADIGHAVLFTPPSKPWTLDKVRVVGEYINLSGDTVFALEIWDNEYNLLYKLSDYSLVYFNTTFKWTEIDIPDITITGDFYVCIFDRTSIIVGADTDNPAMRSYVVIRDPKGMVKEEKLNWMIRAVGA